MEIQGDGEPALRALLKAAVADRIKRDGQQMTTAQIHLRESPKESHASQGAVESGVKTAAALARTGRLAFEKLYGVTLSEDSP
eukprot:14744604-Alexandrium_andersonii.AAC.1